MSQLSWQPQWLEGQKLGKKLSFRWMLLSWRQSGFNRPQISTYIHAGRYHNYHGITSKSSVERNQSTKYLLCFDLVHYSVSGRFLLGQHKCTCTSNHQPAAPAEPGPEVWLELWHQMADLVKAEWRQREQRAVDLKRRGRHWNIVQPQKDHRAF